MARVALVDACGASNFLTPTVYVYEVPDELVDWERNGFEDGFEFAEYVRKNFEPVKVLEFDELQLI